VLPEQGKQGILIVVEGKLYLSLNSWARNMLQATSWGDSTANRRSAREGVNWTCLSTQSRRDRNVKQNGICSMGGIVPSSHGRVFPPTFNYINLTEALLLAEIPPEEPQGILALPCLECQLSGNSYGYRKNAILIE